MLQHDSSGGTGQVLSEALKMVAGEELIDSQYHPKNLNSEVYSEYGPGYFSGLGKRNHPKEQGDQKGY